MCSFIRSSYLHKTFDCSLFFHTFELPTQNIRLQFVLLYVRVTYTKHSIAVCSFIRSSYLHKTFDCSLFFFKLFFFFYFISVSLMFQHGVLLRCCFLFPNLSLPLHIKVLLIKQKTCITLDTPPPPKHTHSVYTL